MDIEYVQLRAWSSTGIGHFRSIRLFFGLALKVPQARDGELYRQTLEKGLRSERALLLAIAEVYVQGVSTRRVKRGFEELCGIDVSSTQISRAAAELA